MLVVMNTTGSLLIRSHGPGRSETCINGWTGTPSDYVKKLIKRSTRKAPRRPLHAPGRGQNETLGLCSFEDDIGQGGKIGGPFEEFVSERAAG
jgi:hypothetical protein